MIYFDHYATMPATPSHLQETMDLLLAADGNPSNSHHCGRLARRAMEDARQHVAALLGSSRHQIFFVSGATEGNHSVVHSLAHRAKGRGANFVITAGEHKCHQRPCEYLAAQGCFELRVLPLNRDGIVEVGSLKTVVDQHTAYVGINHTNHETGMVNSVIELAEAAKQIAPCHVHVDAAQSYGKQPLELLAHAPVDSLTASGHKIGALKGVGCVYMKDPQILSPWLLGGGQERGLRAGTENLAGIISFGLRARDILANPSWLDQTHQLYDELLAQMKRYSQVKLFGHPAHSARSALSFVIADRLADELEVVWNRGGVVMGRGAACSHSDAEGSSVLRAMAASEWEAQNAFRLSLGPQNTVAHLKTFCDILAAELAG